MMDNPYHWLKINPHLFYGIDRIKMIADIRDRLVKGESFAVVGGRRLGKTTFLRRLEQEIKQHSPYLLAVYIDAQAMPYVENSDEAFNWIRTYIGREIGLDLEGADRFGEWITRLVENTHRLRLVLIIDEFDAFSEYAWCHTFFDNLRALIHNTPGVSDRLCVVLAGVRILHTLLIRQGSPLANVLSWKYLSLFNEEDTKRLVNEPTQGRFPPELSEIVWRNTGGHPFLIQFLMHHLCASRTETAFDEVLNQAERRFREEHDIIFKQWWFDHIGERERKIYRAIARGMTIEEIAQRLGYKPGDVQESLKVLSYIGLVRKADGDYNLIGLIFNKWLQENDIEVEQTGQQISGGASLHELFDELEKKLRYFVTRRLEEIGALSSLYKIFPEQVANANKRYSEEHKMTESCPPERIMEYSDFAFPFEVILRYWKQFYEVFPVSAREKILGRDVDKAKQRFEERKDVLARIRNAVRHSRFVDEEDREKARVFCRDILACLGK